MKRMAVVFVVAVLGPSLALAWVAVRLLRDQQSVLERQDQIVCQQIAQRLAGEIGTTVFEQLRVFGEVIDQLLTTSEPGVLAMDFDHQIRNAWPLAQLGFAVALEGEVVSPSMWTSPQALQFRLENDRFLCSRESIEVVWNSPKGQVNLGVPGKVPGLRPSFGSCVYATRTGIGRTFRADASGGAQFRQIVGEAPSGTLARFLQDELNLLFWHRAKRDTNLVYGARINLPALTDLLRPLVADAALPDSAFAATLQDETGNVLAATHEGVTGGKSAFVAVPIGELLPHWEVAVYLLDPARHSRGAATVRGVVGMAIVASLVAIGVGAWLITTDLRRQLTLARQKTDFVSNVSHELKTPLTSIRMFSEMLADGRVRETEKQVHFLRIISGEAARLTRLINNVLDFARLERGDRPYRLETLDLNGLVAATVEIFRPPVEAAGIRVMCQPASQPIPVRVDPDAIAQVLLNLLSNAEKYGASGREITVEVGNEPPNTGTVWVMDRGPGVPSGNEERIFEKFWRGDDSLSSGIQGSGLGLTLARQIARAHGGDLTFQRREGGGSCFKLSVPSGPEAEAAKPPR